MFQANAFQPNAFQHNAETQIIPPTPPELGSWGGGYIDPLVLKDDKRKRKKLNDHLDALRRANAEEAANLHSELLRAYRGEDSAMDVVDVVPVESGDDGGAVSAEPRVSDEVLQNISATLRKPLQAAKASIVVIGDDDDGDEDDIEMLLLYH